MNDKDILVTGTGYAAWGYFFLYFDFNLGPISILPDFVGMLLFFNAIKTLKGLRRELSLLEPLAIMLLVWHLAKWLLAWVGVSLDGLWQPLELIITVSNLYFHFQLLTDFAALARQYLPGTDLSDKLLKWRSIQTVILTGVYLMGYTSGIREGWMEIAAFVVIAVQLFAMLLLMMALFDLRKQFRNMEFETES